MSRPRAPIAITLAILLASLLGAVQVGSAQVTITYFNWFADGTSADVEQRIIDLFEAKHPNIKVEKLGQSGAASVWEKASVMAAGGTPPDVVAVSLAVGLPARQSGALLDLRPFIERDQFNMDRFRPGWQLTTGPDSAWEGKVYGLPWGLGLLNIFYNKDLFAESGVSEPYKGWTTGEYNEALRHLTRDSNGDGIPEVYGSSPPSPSYNQWPFIFGGNMADPETGELTMDRPEFVDALEWVRDLVVNQNVTSSAGGVEAFPGQSVAMTYQWDSYVARLLDWDPGFNWSVTWSPRGGGSETVSYGQGHIIGIMMDSKHHDAAWEFLKFYYSDEAQRLLATNFLYPMTNSGMAAVGELLTFPDPLNSQEILRPYADVGELLTVPWWVPGITEGYAEARSQWSAVLDGTQTPLEWALNFKNAVIAEQSRQR